MNAQKQLPSGPVVQAITVQDGDMRVTVAEDTIKLVRIGPQGGETKPAITMKAEEVDRLIRLLQLARDQQQSFAEAIRGRP